MVVLVIIVLLGVCGILMIRSALRRPAPVNRCRAPGCGQDNLAEARFCGHCGASLGDEERR
jgi:hypothetical protein